MMFNRGFFAFFSLHWMLQTSLAILKRLMSTVCYRMPNWFNSENEKTFLKRNQLSLRKWHTTRWGCFTFRFLSRASERSRENVRWFLHKMRLSPKLFLAGRANSSHSTSRFLSLQVVTASILVFSGHPILSYREQHLARLLELHLLCIPVLLQHLRVIWTQRIWDRAEELGSCRTSSLHQGMAVWCWRKSPCPSQKRREKWDGVHGSEQ